MKIGREQRARTWGMVGVGGGQEEEPEMHAELYP